MCGILGYINADCVHRHHDFQQALDILTHRGPDDRGVYADKNVLIGHRRLSIIDLTSAAHQPMIDSASGAVISYNGEIYNYQELRCELEGLGHVFQTASDTEVLLRAFLEWDEQSLSRLNGMWAFALWMPQSKQMFFSRDRFGVKPFYYRCGSNGFAFASEPKALLALFPQHRVVCEQTLYEFLDQGLLYATDRSFYNDVLVLPPGHCGVYDVESASLKIWRYWDYPDQSSESIPLEQACEEFFVLLDDAVRLRLRSDVPVGVTLSGGLDSTAVLASSMQARQSRRVCFTSVYSDGECGEAVWAETAAALYGIEPIQVAASRREWSDTLTRIAWHMDGPGYSPAVYPLWCLMREARSMGVPVLLEGQGADEALGGYPQYAVLDFLKGLRSRWWSVPDWHAMASDWRRLTGTFTLRWMVLWALREQFPRLVQLNRRCSGASSTLRPDFVQRITRRQLTEAVSQQCAMSDPATERMRLDHSRNILPGLLHYGDAISMAHGIESRLPFMDYRLVEWAFLRSAAVKIHCGQTKWVLREYLRQRGQEQIAARRDKQGYPTPLERWLGEKDGALARQILLAAGARLHRFCDPKAISVLIDAHVHGRPGTGNHLYRLVSTEAWLNVNGL